MASFALLTPPTRATRCQQAPLVRGSGACRASAGPAGAEVSGSRRAVAATLLTLPALLAARPALALLPDDEDEELLAKAKAGRQAKIAAEKTSGRAFVASEGYSSPADIAALQTAVNALSKTGSLLASGQLEEAKTLASGLWVGELKRVFANGPASLSATSNKTLAGISSLQKATALGAAKADYVAAVSALEEWTAVAGVAAKLKGL